MTLRPPLQGDLEARCGYRLQLSFPPAEKTGEFWDTLKVTVRSDDDPPEFREVTWQIAGSTRPRAQISGKKFTPHNSVIASLVDKVLRSEQLFALQGFLRSRCRARKPDRSR